MAAAAPDRLSDLPDDLLIHILSFVTPFRKAASTTVLSRRWRRPLWLETGVVHLDHRSYTTTPRAVRMLDDASRAQTLYRSLGRCPRKLTLLMSDEIDDDEVEDAAAVEEEDEVREAEEECASVEAGVFAGVEELRIEWLDCTSPTNCKHALSSGLLAYTALRVLEMTGYVLQPYSEGSRCLAFPCLEDMRLRRCRTEIATLRDMIYAAPRLASIRLEAVCFVGDQQEYFLHCPTATVIVIADLHVFHSYIDGCRVKLDAPCVRSLYYTHIVTLEETYFSLEPHLPPDLEQVHLAVHSGSTRAALVRSSIITSVRHVRFLKLTAYSIADLHDVMEHGLLNLERLEIEELSGWCTRNYFKTASAFVDLMCGCPGMRELRLKFSWRKYLDETTDLVNQKAAMSDFSPCRSIVNAGDDDEEDCCDRLYLHKLSCGRKPDCLENSLRRVVVEFDMEELTCFQVRLVKFLAENATALEQFVVNGGKGHDSSHVDRKIARWRARRRSALSPLPQMTNREMTPRSRWPPPLSEFPPLAPAPDIDPVPASPGSDVPASIAC